MRRTLLIPLLMVFSFNAEAQFTYKQLSQKNYARLLVCDMAQSDEAWIKVENIEYPLHHEGSSEAKQVRNTERFIDNNKLYKNAYLTTPEELMPDTVVSFNGLPVGGAGIPNDNNMAVSDNGYVVSVINSSVSIFKSDGSFIRYKTLRSIVGNALPNLDRTYDPKILLDPVAQKFILVFLQGSTSADTRIVVGFTQTDNPDGLWNFYALNGNPFSQTTWSDYPVIGMNDRDLFITVNILKDNESWQEGFTQSVIWQINKNSGFNGDTLVNEFYYDLKYNNQPIWSICPVQTTPQTHNDGLYLLSVRPSTLQNDSLFIHHIKGSAGNNTYYTLSVAKGNIPYGVPPSAYQPAAGFRLQTNDTRVLSAFQHQNHIQYVQTTYVPSNKMSGVFHAIIELNKPQLFAANYITNDSFDLAYPSIASMASDYLSAYASVITCSKSSLYQFPGTVAIVHNKAWGLPSLYSNVQNIRQGDGLINTFLADSAERWGDYTAVQRQYNTDNKAWICGSYGTTTNRNGVWISELSIINRAEILVTKQSMLVFPNPVTMPSLSVKVNIINTDVYEVAIVSALGQQVYKTTTLNLFRGENILSVDVAGLSPGQYYLSFKSGKQSQVLSGRFIVSPQ